MGGFVSLGNHLGEGRGFSRNVLVEAEAVGRFVLITDEGWWHRCRGAGESHRNGKNPSTKHSKKQKSVIAFDQIITI